MSWYWLWLGDPPGLALLVAAAASALLAGVSAAAAASLRRQRRTMMSICPGQVDPGCTCASQPCAGLCACAPCTAATMQYLPPQPAPPPFRPLASFAKPGSQPRGSGGGMTGFAESGAGNFEPAFDMKPVTGLRQWTLAGPNLRDDPLTAEKGWPLAPLTGATGFNWTDGVIEATCNNGYDHPVPTEYDEVRKLKCGCGVWAYWKLDSSDLNRFSPTSRGLPVLGVVEGYGRVVLGTKGFRAQKAKIIALAPAFSIQPEIYPASYADRMFGQRFGSEVPGYEAAVPAEEAKRDAEEVQQRAQQHADAWMAMIQERLEYMYPDVAVYATARGMLASVEIRGKP